MSSALISPAVMELTYCHIRLRLVCMTPLGRDSVPLVYMTLSNWSSCTCGLGGGDVVARHCWKSIHPGGAGDAAAAIAIRVETLPPRLIASCATATNSVSTMKPVARQ